MLDQLLATFAALKADASGLSLGVQIWMKGIALSMLLGVFVAAVDRRALWVVGAMILTMISLFVVKGLWPAIPRGEIGTWAHLLIWPPALAGLWLGSGGKGQGAAHPVWRGWRYWVSGLMAISLVLDARNAVNSLI